MLEGKQRGSNRAASYGRQRCAPHGKREAATLGAIEVACGADVHVGRAASFRPEVEIDGGVTRVLVEQQRP